MVWIVTHEPLVPLALAVAAEVDRLDIRAFVHVDEATGTVLVDGIGGPVTRARILVALGKARLRVEVARDCDSRLIVYPS
jgi:hypothetical protein